MPKPVTANQLRWLGEEADGKRGKDYVVVWRGDGDAETLGVAETGKLASNEKVVTSIEVRTDLEGQGLLGDAKIQLVYKGQVIDVTGADSIFITQSSFEKFVIPYYTRFRSPSEIGWMKHNFFADDYIAVAHFPPSIPWGVPGKGFEEAPPGNLNIVHVNGLITPAI
jgi:hypothetical protein